MRRLGNTVILILLGLQVCLQYTVGKPDVSEYLQKTSPKSSTRTKICISDKKPFRYKKSETSTSQTLPNAVNSPRINNHKYPLYTTNASPLLIQSKFGMIMPPTGLWTNVLQKPPFHDNLSKLPQSVHRYPPNLGIHGSLLYNAPPLNYGKYEITTVKNTIKHSLGDLILPSRGYPMYGSETAIEPFFATASQLYKENKSVDASLFDTFIHSLDIFERKFYQSTFNKLLAISPENRLENGISFAQSGLFIYLVLMALTAGVDLDTSAEIESTLGIQASGSEKTNLLRHTVSWLPRSSHDLKFRWATRLVLEAGLPVRQELIERTATALKLHVEWLNGNASLDNLTSTLNAMVKTDSGGAMRNTFDEDDFSEGACSILLSTAYIRARWRSPPTVLNGSYPFRDTKLDPERFVRMIRINDIMRYAFLEEWHAEVLEIRYATPGLTLLLLVPEGHSLKNLALNLGTTSLDKIYKRMREIRVAAVLPIYTLRMTLLLHGKLQAMGINRLMNAKHSKGGGCGELRLSHAVQRLMFWAEAGRNAFKDDGIEWDEVPEKEIIVDHPYIFYVRWQNVTLMNGHFVL